MVIGHDDVEVAKFEDIALVTPNSNPSDVKSTLLGV